MSMRPNRPGRGGGDREGRGGSDRGGSERGGGERNRGGSDRGGGERERPEDRRGGGGRSADGTPTSELPAMERAMERAVDRERADEVRMAEQLKTRVQKRFDELGMANSASSVVAPQSVLNVENSGSGSTIDLDLTVLSFAQWVSEMKSRQNNSHHQMQAEMSIIRNAISSNNTDLGDFKRHSAAIQQQMQSEINEIRESLSSVFMEITGAVRDNAAADQDIKLKIQSLNEQAVRNETAFAQLADAADQSQSKLRNAVQEMQLQSERMREELGSLTRINENLETSLSDRYNRIAVDMDRVGNDLHVQLERRKEHLKKMVNDVMMIGESLHNLVADFGDQKKMTFEVQNQLQSNLYIVDQALRPVEDPLTRGRPPLRTQALSSESLPQARTLTPQRTPDQPVNVLQGTTSSMTLPANMRTVPVTTAAALPTQAMAAAMGGTMPMPARSIVYR
mmetsp:Transcript_77907/g.147134  ORF Transcript_77907/g.147134 Transcript_77907/m.147134 type:complete len:451 (+) Transcript_77907:78-1430(+)